ncbi:hypothetical protein DFH09DRAFT_900028 [Mycena vulgaris]|nr:hypothetical protein DFH09DRAFT_900028 [Mycena vulgaris]
MVNIPRPSIKTYATHRVLEEFEVGPSPQDSSSSSPARERLSSSGLPLENSGPTTAALLAYAAAHWPPPPVLPAGWRADWDKWPHLLTLFAYSPYFLRLPQIEMLVAVRHAVPGEVRPLMYHPTRDALVFQIDVADEDEGDGENEGAQIFYMDCDKFELWTYARGDADTVDELVLLIGAAATPESVPLVRLPPDPAGAEALKRILSRDASVIPVLEEEFLGYAPRATTPEEELQSADAADRSVRDRLEEAIRSARGYIMDAEKELRVERRDLEAGRKEGLDVRVDEAAHAEVRAAVEEAKEKLAEWEELWSAQYGPWKD